MGKINKYTRYKDHYKTMLKNIINSYFIFEGLPESIDGRYLKHMLITELTPAAFMYKNQVVVTNGAASGLDMYYRPTLFTPANPYITLAKPLKVGTECAICYLTEDYTRPFNFNQLINIYASRLADLDISCDTSARNSRVCNIVLVDNDREAIRTGKILDEMYNDGRASVMSYKTGFNRDNAPAIFPIKAKDNIVTSELADARRNVLSDFYSYLGINTIAVDKKERTNLLEMNSNGEQLTINCDIWEKNINLWCDEVNTLFNTNISFRLNKEPLMVQYDEEGADNDYTADSTD